MARPPSGPINRLTKDELESLIAKSASIRELLKSIGVRNHGSNHNTLVRRAKRDNIDLSKFQANFRKGVRRPRRKLEDVLVENSDYSRVMLKKRLLKLGLLKEECSICGIGPAWLNKKLVLILDHKNGIFNDNRLDNLRMLCPNCNSQTDTFAARNKCYRLSRREYGDKTEN